jgi:hypothetical protein
MDLIVPATVLVISFEGVLHEQAALNGVGRAFEGDHESVADGLDDPPIEVGYDRHEEVVVGLKTSHESLTADGFRVSCEPGDVCEHHGEVLLDVLHEGRIQDSDQSRKRPWLVAEIRNQESARRWEPKAKNLELIFRPPLLVTTVA